jgi:hypothetical protein
MGLGGCFTFFVGRRGMSKFLEKLKQKFDGDGPGAGADRRDSGGKKRTKVFEFNEQAIGMVLSKNESGKSTVARVVPNGEAHRLGVKEGDIIVAIENNYVGHEQFVELLQAFPRPVTVEILREKPDVFASLKGSFASAMHGSTKPGKDAAAPVPSELSDAEKRAKREALLAAAEQRTKHWDDRIQKGRAASATSATSRVAKYQIDVATLPPPSSHPATLREIEAAREREREMAMQLGYNPFEAKVLGRAEPSPPRDIAVDSLEVAEESFAGEREVLTSELHETVAKVMSGGGEGAPLALQTMQKMLLNMVTRSEDKFKRIRLNNAAFQSKVVAIPGAMDLMLWAGFELCSDEAESYLFYPFCAGPPTPLRLYICIETLQQVGQQAQG